MPLAAQAVNIRLAVSADIPGLRALSDASDRGLQAQNYTPTQIEGARRTVYGVDSQLIADGTYFVAEADSPQPVAEPGDAGAKHAASGLVIVGCGGWSKRQTLFGGDHWSGRQDALLDPLHDAAKIRAFFVHPAWGRRGIGGLILEACESAAQAAGFTRYEMGPTMPPVPFYQPKGYVA